MKKCYLVTEFGGQWEDSWETPIKVFLSEDNAINYINKHQKEISESSLKVPYEAYIMMTDIAMNMFPEDTSTDFPELIMKTGKFPEYTLEDLKLTNEYQRRLEMNWIGFNITELDLCQ